MTKSKTQTRVTFTDSDGDVFTITENNNGSPILELEVDTVGGTNYGLEFYKADAESIINIIREAAK